MNDLQLISADVMDLRSDPPILYSMNTSELDELSSRLKDINMTGVDDDLMGMTPYYSIKVTDQKVEGFSVSGFDTDGNHVGILYQGHYYRVQDDAFSRYLQNICAGYQRADALPRLTLDDVVTLSKKGNALSWSDFERYQGQDIGSGLYIMRYEIDELFDVLVGGVPDETPWYIYLRVNNEADDRIDIRTEDVATFVEAHRNDTPKVIEPKPDGGGKPAPEEPDFSTLSEEQTAIRQAIREHNRSADPTGFASCASFTEIACIVVDGSDFSEYTHYGWVLYNEYKVTDNGLETTTGSHVPVAITFREDPSGTLTLEEYWEPRDGSYYVQDIREKFPAHIVEDGMDSQKFILQQTQECYAQAVASTGLDTDKVIGSLIETICSGPASSSNPGDYIEAHPIEYRELTYYGRYTLKYCFARFEEGGETGLAGQIMAQACEDIAAGWGEEPLTFFLPYNAVPTGQAWYSAFKNNALRLMEQYSEIELAERCPASYLLLGMLGEI